MWKMGRFGFLIVIGLVLQSDRCYMTDRVSDLGSETGMSVFRYLVNSTELDNIAISPYGIGAILAMLQLGASRRTKKQLTNILKYNTFDARQSLETVRRHLTEKNKDTVIISSGIFPDASLDLERPFVNKIKKIFQAEVKSLDFGSTEQAASSINNWVAKQTEGMIDHLISSDDLINSPMLVVVNAVYFQGLWNSQFNPKNTHKEEFRAADGNIYQVPMMAQASHFKFGIAASPLNNLRYYVLELPYQGTISMFIALPVDTGRHRQLWDIASNFKVSTIQNWQAILKPKHLTVVMPKFTADVQTDLVEPLSALGLTAMFDPMRASFPRISRTAAIFVSNMFQRAKIEVNEQGTEASAATGAIFMLKSASSNVPFTLNRPFLYFIQHKPTGAVLFAGQFSKPAVY